MAQTRRSSATRNRKARSGSSPARRRGSGASRSGRSVGEGAQGGAKAISTAAGKLTGPAIVGGAALAGLAGGIALGAKRNSRRKPLSLGAGNGLGKTGKDLAEAGKEVSRFTENLGEVAGEIRRIREAIDDRSKHRSPIEIVLQALTARR